MATPTHTLAAQFQNAWSPGKRLASVRTIVYWMCTFLVAFEMMAGGFWDLLRIDYVQVILAHLGYPMYLLTIIGVWKIPCAVVLFLPGFLRLKEWAYAGAVFNYTGAVASHLLVGDSTWVAPLVLTGVTLASWALRSPARSLTAPALRADRRIAAWLVPALVLVALAVAALATLPKGAPPS